MDRADEVMAHERGPGALPRKNGELVFAAPWESRAFGIAVAMRRRGAYGWDEFRDRLISHISEDEAAPYYESWLASLQDVLEASGVVSAEEIEQRIRQLARE